MRGTPSTWLGYQITESMEQVQEEAQDIPSRAGETRAAQALASRTCDAGPRDKEGQTCCMRTTLTISTLRCMNAQTREVGGKQEWNFPTEANSVDISYFIAPFRGHCQDRT